MNEFLSFIKDNILGGLSVSLNFGKFRSAAAEEFEFTENENGGVFSWNVPGYDSFTLTVKVSDDSAIFYIDTKHYHDSFNRFRLDNAVNFPIGGEVKAEAVRAYYHMYTCCLQPMACGCLEQLLRRTHTAVAKYGDVHVNILGLVGEDYRCDFDGEGVHISFTESGRQDLSGPFLVVSRADDPFKAVKKSYLCARKEGAIRVPLKTEREIPDITGKLGYCTFNTYDLDITSELIYKKLDEYKEKNVPLRWVLIDDGWQNYVGKFMIGTEHDPVKIPEGLKAMISRIKKDYGVEKVGVWHAMTAYWNGIKEGSEAHLKMADKLMKTNGGLIIPSLDEEKGMAFWDEWYAYLADCGVDFVKIDSQSQYPETTEGEMSTMEACRRGHRYIEEAAKKYFGGTIINCMGMDCENVYARPYSVIARNSRDFGLYEECSFYDNIHDFAMVNVYGAVWHDMMCCCDFDMWWSSDKESAVHSATLRAIHDGPCYLSDPDECDPEVIYRTVGRDGTHFRFDHAAYPTLDCFYGAGSVFRAWNEKGDDFATVIYNITADEVKDSFDISAVPAADVNSEYAAFEFFTGAWRRVKGDDVIDDVLGGDAIRAYSFYKIYEDELGEYVMKGDTERYVSSADPDKKKTYLNEIM